MVVQKDSQDKAPDEAVWRWQVRRQQPTLRRTSMLEESNGSVPFRWTQTFESAYEWTYRSEGKAIKTCEVK